MSIWQYQDNFDFRKDVGPEHPFHYPLESHRGDYSRQKMLSAFHLGPEGELRPDARLRRSEAVLFGGHLGCGKSTELRDYAERLGKSYTVSLMELTKLLDINNLRFSDLLVALAQALVQKFEDESLSIRPDSIYVEPVVQWFETRILRQDRYKELGGEITASVGGGIPLLAKLLAKMTAKFRTGASYREELRTEIRNGFSDLVNAFNALASHANDLLERQSRGPLLFIIDGTDKLAKEDAATFFGADINQLGQIIINMIVCAPIPVLLETGGIAQRFTRVQLPMVKIYEADETPRPAQEEALVQLVLKRMPLEYFDHRDTVLHFVRCSGGHVRDLLRLVRAAFARLDGDRITRDIADMAVRDVAVDYQRLIHKDDWSDLVAIDASYGLLTDRTDDRLRMLYDLILLEYNSYWWRSHPLVRTLSAYQRNKQAAVPPFTSA